MADKISDETALAMLDSVAEAVGQGTNFRTDAHTIRQARAHIAARLGGGEAPVAWLHVRKRDGMIRGHTTEPPSEVMLACAEADGDEYRPVYYSPPARLAATAVGVTEARPLEDYHEDEGPVVWWKFPIDEAPWIGSPGDSDWPGYHTHWTPHPPIPALEAALANQTKDTDHE